MKTRLEEVEELLNRIDDELYEELNPSCYDGGICTSTIEDLIEEKVKLEIEKDRLTRDFSKTIDLPFHI